MLRSVRNLQSNLLVLGAALAAALVPAAVLAGPPQQVFMDNCSACHRPNGLGVPGAFPALAGDRFVLGDARPAVLTVLNGRGGMPAFKTSLSDADIAAALTYVRTAWGNKAKPVSAAEVAKARASGAPAPPRAGLQAH